MYMNLKIGSFANLNERQFRLIWKSLLIELESAKANRI